jgi:transcriptional regulator with XRE-family HTH domain
MSESKSPMNLEHAHLIGEKLRAARQQRQLSLRKLSVKAEISASMLSQIETGKAYPSVRSIYSIAAALGLPVDYFFPEPKGTSAHEALSEANGITASEMREATFNRPESALDLTAITLDPATVEILHAAARPTIVLKSGVTWSRLTASAETSIEFLEVNYACGATSGEHLSHHEGREFGLVLEGELELHLAFQQIVLHAGDTIVFDSMTPHRLSNNGSTPMRALWVIWNPSFNST